MPFDYPPNVNFLDLWREKLFLGQEFLSWLWLTSEMDSRFPGPNGSTIEVRFEKKLTLETGQGLSRSQVACQNPDNDWTEGFVALGLGKKIVKAQLTIRAEGLECSLALPADTLGPQSVKIATSSEVVDDEGPLGQAGRFLNKVALLVSLKAIIDHLFLSFLKVRLAEDWPTNELTKLKEFLEPWLLSQEPS
ncbi:MAG: hypothetical protein LBR11_00805 [Deltaproteobacteria bacterium]|nr:hypothetical protein [Deltaproteobacteria bacterium]